MLSLQHEDPPLFGLVMSAALLVNFKRDNKEFPLVTLANRCCKGFPFEPSVASKREAEAVKEL